MKLVSINQDNYELTINMSVKSEQEKFIASNLVSLAEAYVYREFAEAYLLYDDAKYIGFCLLQVDVKNDYFDIWRIMIDQKYQGKGYGLKALKVIMDYLKNKNAKIIHISHQENNYGVGTLYKKVGFEYTGEIEDGEVLMEYKV
jgi:diamine N-acetyltransferase